MKEGRGLSDMELKIRLNTIKKIKDFSNIVSKFDADMDLIASNSQYIVDAKSIMGIFSLDLSKDLTLVVHKENTDKIKSALRDFIV